MSKTNNTTTNGGHKGNNKYKGNNKGNSNPKEAMKPMNNNKDKFGKITSKPATNDPDWYFTNKEIAEQVANFPFPYFLGSVKNCGNVSVPTCMVAFANPSVGITFNRNAEPTVGGANMAAQKLYTRLSIASGRAANYQQNDVLLSIVSVTEIVSVIEFARRFFGVATTFNQRNRVFAQRILGMLIGEQSTSITPDFNSVFGADFVAHLADYRMQLNSIITKVNQIPILADIGYVRKSTEIYQKIFLDDTTDTAQIYAVSPYSTWQLDETVETGSILRTIPIVGSVTTFADLLTILDNMVNTLLNSTTLNYVYADIFNYQAKFSLNLFQMGYVLEGYSVIPEYSDRFLQQIHNASALGAPISQAIYDAQSAAAKQICTPLNDVYSDPTTGLVKYNPVFQYCWTGAAGSMSTLLAKLKNGKFWFDFNTTSPTLEDKVDNIMFKAGLPTRYVGATGDESVNKLATCALLPDHYFTYFMIFGPYSSSYLTFTNSGLELEARNTRNIKNNQASLISHSVTPNVSSLLTAFRMAPLLIDYWVDQADTGEPGSIFGEKTYLTSLNREHMDLMFELIYQGLFELR